MLTMRFQLIALSTLEKSITNIEAFCELLLEVWKKKKHIKRKKISMETEIPNFSLMISKEKERLDLVL